MKNATLVFTLLLFFISTNCFGQTLKDKKNAFISYTTGFNPDLIESLDKSKLSSKEQKLFDKFMDELRSRYESIITEKLYKALEEKSLTVLPMNHLASKLKYDDKPVTILVKRSIKKKKLAEDADYFLSSNISCSKALLSIGKSKAQINYGVAIFDGNGKKIGKINGIVKSDEGIGRLSFGGIGNVFSKIDASFIPLILEKLDPLFDKTVERMVSEIEEL